MGSPRRRGGAPRERSAKIVGHVQIQGDPLPARDQFQHRLKRNGGGRVCERRCVRARRAMVAEPHEPRQRFARRARGGVRRLDSTPPTICQIHRQRR